MGVFAIDGRAVAAALYVNAASAVGWIATVTVGGLALLGLVYLAIKRSGW